MKVYISADIEGVTGVTSWDEAESDKPEYMRFAEQMTREVKAACQGAIKAGASEIWIKDAHNTARNIDPREMPKNSRLVRGWSGHPFAMVQELDETFDAALFIGYHSCAGSNDNPLAHTMSGKVRYIKINDKFISEFLLNAYAAASVGVPVVFVSGDKGLCSEVKRVNNNIITLGVKDGIGGSTINMNPDLAVELIEKEVEKALTRDLKLGEIRLPERFKVEICFAKHADAYKASFYPGMKEMSSNSVLYESDNYFDVLTMINFVV